MEQYDVRRLALVLAVQAEIEGMKADNNGRMQREESNAYTDADFCAKAEEMRNLAFCHNEQL
jgi:hypothetical protein